jgi:hypothetical protein
VSDLLGIAAAIAVFVLPLALAWWLLGRPDRRRGRKDDPAREKMNR